MAEKKEKIKVSRIEIEPAENGGHAVTHHYKSSPHHSLKHGVSMQYHEPERHVFGAGEGHSMLAHVANALQVPEQDGADEGETEEEGQ